MWGLWSQSWIARSIWRKWLNFAPKEKSIGEFGWVNKLLLVIAKIGINWTSSVVLWQEELNENSPRHRIRIGCASEFIPQHHVHCVKCREIEAIWSSFSRKFMNILSQIDRMYPEASSELTTIHIGTSWKFRYQIELGLPGKWVRDPRVSSWSSLTGWI